MKKSNLISETKLYSINPVRKNRKGETIGGEVIVHHLPYPSTSPQLEKYLARGFTFERPPEPTIKKSDEITCPICGRVCKSQFGLQAHLRSHKEK